MQNTQTAPACKSKKACPHCGISLKNKEFKAHVDGCLKDSRALEAQKKLPVFVKPTKK